MACRFALAWARPLGGRLVATRGFPRQLMIGIIAVAFAPVVGAATEPLQPATFVSVSASVVRVEAEGERGGLSVGSGVTVAPSIVVTNCHVTRNATAIRVAGAGSTWPVTEQYADGTQDLCFLHAP